MKKFISKQKNCLLSMIILIILCELLLKIDNKIIQSLGICLTPFIIIFGVLFLKNDKQKDINK
ncbi:MAG: hypothetical protein IJY25_01640 [Bacilli bacterium]|nr:hypothetical protein [Bacilli bacterium]